MSEPPIVMLHPMLLSPVVGLLLGLVAIRVVQKLAIATGFVDNPDRRRKLHEMPIPLGGGIAVWLATWCGWGAGMLVALRLGTTGGTLALWHSAALAVASLLILALGAVDDRRGMRGCHKLAGQVLVAVLMVASGLRIDALSGFGVVLELGSLGSPLTVLGVVLVINAFNLIDGLDGFCGGISFVVAVALAVMAARAGRIEDALIALALAGALVAFLQTNLPPARIYLGDAGSMSLGMILAVLAVRACGGSPGTPVALPPLLAMLALPLLDVATALGRRWLAGRSLFVPDRGHIHHRLRVRLGGTAAATAAAVALATMGACGAVLAGVPGLGDGVAALAIIAPIGVLVGTDTFGGSELRLLLFRFKRDSARFLVGGSTKVRLIRQECRLHGGRDWAVVWDELIRAVEAADVRRIEMAIDMPAAGETYQGLWSLLSAEDGSPHWSVVHSIQVRGVHAGELRVSGGIDEFRDRYLDKVEELVRILEAHLETDAIPAHHHAPSGLSSPNLGRVVLPGSKI